MKLLLLYETTNLSERVARADKLLRIFQTIFSKPNLGKVFVYLLENGACTAWLLQVHLDIQKATTYNCLNNLKKLGLAEPIKQIRKNINSKGGPRPTVWALIDAHNDDIARAIQLHYRAQSPKYRIAEEFANSFITDYLDPRGLNEIGYSELFLLIKEKNYPYTPRDLATIASNCLRDKGIKVWR